MPKERRLRSQSSDQSTTNPYCCSSKTTAQNPSKNRVKSVGEEREWEEAKCPICMDPPHNAVLLICSCHDKGCRPYMCDTSSPLSNCFEQFHKSSSSNQQLSCPLCRGKISEWMVVKPAREFMDAIPRSCFVEACKFSGTYAELSKHASLDHPSMRPSETGPTRQQRRWRSTARIRVGGYVLGHQFASRTVAGQTGNDAGGPSRQMRTTPRMSTGGRAPRHQLAARTVEGQTGNNAGSAL